MRFINGKFKGFGRKSEPERWHPPFHLLLIHVLQPATNERHRQPQEQRQPRRILRRSDRTQPGAGCTKAAAHRTVLQNINDPAVFAFGTDIQTAGAQLLTFRAWFVQSHNILRHADTGAAVLQ